MSLKRRTPRAASREEHLPANNKLAREASQRLFLSHIEIHENEVTDTASHDKQMKDFMRTKKFMLSIENREL